jgi:glycogen phosphorylase
VFVEVVKIDFSKLHIAYFSMEIGIHEDVPTYSGGLGVLAGDTLRSMADLKVPVIGVCLLYREGYFKQIINELGEQIEEKVHWDPHEHLRELDKVVEVNIEGRNVKLKAWQYNLRGSSGHINPIIFLDANIEGNSDYDKKLTGQLYGKDNKYRLAQEIILGIGGVRMLEALGCSGVHKFHMNEGHSALLTLELSKREQNKEDFIEEVRKKCVFTTHTPVPAGHDSFDRELAEQLLQDFLTDDLKKEIFLDNKLNMTYLGLRFSQFVNGVAKKHGEVSRTMFPGYHIESITNGVHSLFWTSKNFQKVFNKFLPSWKSDFFSLRYILGIPKENIWDAHMEDKRELFSFINEKYKVNFDPDIFTIGFARRAATYKRGDMLLEDTERLLKIAKKFKGLQIIFGGKAHPNDSQGKEIIKKIISRMNSIKQDIKICYIENYDIKVAKLLTSGVDLWLNTPQRPMEASGTSGMKAAHNGIPQFSTLDGWWLEGLIENVTGWSIGSHPNSVRESSHEEDVEDMYTKLEYIIMPKYYNERDEWIEIMQHCIAINGSFFNTHRMVQQYFLNAYYL